MKRKRLKEETKRFSIADVFIPTIEELRETFCEKFGDDALAFSDFYAMGALCRAVYKRYGDEALEIIEDLCGKRGVANAQMAKEQLPDLKMGSLKKWFKDVVANGELEFGTIKITENKIDFTLPKCFYGLENTMVDHKVCDAIMAMDKNMFPAIIGGVTFEIIKGPPDCHCVIKGLE